MRCRNTYPIVLCLLSFLPAAVRAQEPGPDARESGKEQAVVVNVGDAHVDADPGSALTLGFNVYNGNSKPAIFSSHVDVPEGWSVTASGDVFELGPSERALRLISVGIPSGSAPGSYRVGFTAQSVDGKFGGVAELMVEVRVRRGLQIHVIDAPRVVSASMPHAVDFVVHNTSNTTATTHLTVESTPFSAVLVEEIITITANGSYPIRVQIEPDPNLTSRTRSSVRLRGSLAEDPTIVADAEAIVGVIPDGARVNSLRPRVELNTRVSSSGDQNSQGLQTEITGRVPLSGDSLHQAEFILRTPSTTRSVLSQADMYALSYTGPRFWSKLGDHVFHVSPLVSAGRFGTGVGVGALIGKVAVEGHFRRSRHSIVTDREAAGSVAYDLEKWGRYSINALAGNGLVDGYAGSLRYELAVLEALSVDVEGGVSGRDNADAMYSIGARGRLKETGYYLRAIHRGPEHPGQLSSYSSQLLGVSSLVREGMSISMTLSNEATGASGGDLPSRYRRFASAAITGQHRHQDLVASGRLELRRETLAYTIDGSETATQLSQLRLRAGIAVRRLRVSSSVDVARISSAFGREGINSRIELESSWNKDSHLVQASVVRETGPSLQVLQPSSYMSFRLSGEEQLTNQLKLRVNIMGTLIEESVNMTTGIGWAGLEYQFPDGKRLGAEVQLAMHGGIYVANQVSYRLTLDIPLSASNPIPMQGALLEGAVVDETTGQGIADVLVIVGDQSVFTGADGRFALRRPAAGSYHLLVDRVTLGLNRVPSISMPMLIDVPAQGHLDFIRIPVSSRGELHGEVRLFDVRGGAGSIPTDTVDVGPAGQVVVEISSGNIRYRRPSNPNGSFSFPDLPPGMWSVRVLEQTVPSGFDSEQRIYTVELPSSDPLYIRLLSVSRPRRLLNGGDLHGPTSGGMLRPRRN